MVVAVVVVVGKAPPDIIMRVGEGSTLWLPMAPGASKAVGVTLSVGSMVMVWGASRPCCGGEGVCVARLGRRCKEG